MKPTMFLPIALLLFTAGCLFVGSGESVPEPDDCTSPRALEGIESVEIGRIEADAFVPWVNGQPVELTYGSQGGAMLGVILSVRGRDLPACMAHDMTLATPDIDPLAVTSYPVQTYEGAGDTRITRMIWLILNGPEPAPGTALDLELQLGDLALQRTLVVQ
jgi:hypothetical protein